MDGWMDYTSLCIDHGPLAGGISATRGGLPVSTYNPRDAFVSSDHSLLSDNPDMPLLQGRWRFIYVLDVQAVEACNSLSRMLFLTIPGMYREG